VAVTMVVAAIVRVVVAMVMVMVVREQVVGGHA
jgi:hypothetical protein